MKINIVYNFNDGAWGGGNQFLKALRNRFVKEGCYVDCPEVADVILFNSHHCLNSVIQLKQKYPTKIFVHRIDGPIFYIRGHDIELDRNVFLINNNLSDISIFQSKWSYEKCSGIGYAKNHYEKIIHNATDPNIFNRQKKTPFDPDQKIKLIATSWSDNWRKGFHLYAWLDEHLDFDKYDFTFVGNSPVDFKNIRHICPLPSEKLSEQLQEHDIFITASENDPCSNSLVEAMSCGLPVVVKNDGGHPELIKNGGMTFNTREECLDAIETVSANYRAYQKNVNPISIEQTACEYYRMMNMVYKRYVSGEYHPKKPSVWLPYQNMQTSAMNRIKNILRTVRTECSHVLSSTHITGGLQHET